MEERAIHRTAKVLRRYSRSEAYHSHAFTWWLKGRVVEEFADNSKLKTWEPSLKPKYTPRNCFHRVRALQTSWTIPFRGPWKEKKQDREYTLAKRT